MNVIYRVHGAGGFYMETQSQDQAFRTDPWFPGSYKLY